MQRHPQPQPNNSLSRLRERAGVRARARHLRRQQTDAEALLWSKLRNRQLQGLKFKRQYPVAGFFADFACLELHLIVELDGGQHADASGLQHDAQRSRVLAANGFTVLRFWNNETLQNMEGVLESIRQYADTRSATLTPALSRQREREPHSPHDAFS